MRFADNDGKVADALEMEPPEEARCLLCGGNVTLRGGAFGTLSLLTAGSVSHYAHKGKSCGYSKKHDQLIEKRLAELTQ